MHHAWLLVGPEGVGKASFATAAAARLLAEAAGEVDLPPGLALPSSSRTRQLLDAGSHPDFRVLARLPKDPEKPDQDIARSITIAQIRALGPMFATRPSMGPRRVVVIDAADDLERSGANALLKSLEEPPAGTVFLLISHAPGRLLPTIRSRCRLLRFEALDDDKMAMALRQSLPDAEQADIAALVAAGEGAPGQALRYAGLDVWCLHLVRNPVSVAESWRSGKGAMDDNLPTYTQGQTYKRWMLKNLACESLRLAMPYKRVRFEQFTAAPQAGLSEIKQWIPALRGRSDGFASESEVDFGPFHSLQGNPDRFENGRVTIRASRARPLTDSGLSWAQRNLATRYGYGA